MTAGTDPVPQDGGAYARSGVPELGFRNYWYPVLASWRLRRKPKAIRLLGEEVVLFRDKGEVFALADRCPHRGARLSQGKTIFPGSGTLTCPYHGWTYSGQTGRCVAKLMEGPNAPMAKGAGVTSYPVKVFRGVIWLFVGDMEAVPLDEDLPDCMADTKEWSAVSTWRTYRCNWRVLKDNLCHDQHAPFLHRTAPELMFQPIFPHASTLSAEPLEGGKGIGYVAKGGISSADHPGLGHFPPRQESWFRVLRPVGRGKELDPARSPAVVKYGIRHRQMSFLPGITLIGRPSGTYFMCRWITPVDEKTTLYYTFSLYRRRGIAAALRDWTGWTLWYSWAHDWLFSDQDKRILERVETRSEQLSATDVGVAAWRRFAVANARRPATQAESAESSVKPAAE